MVSRPRSLSHIARHFDLRDWVLALVNIRMGSDREAAILSVSMIDRGLESAILSDFVELSKRQTEALFEGSGPLVSFSAKIKIAHAIGIINDQVRIDLEKIRQVRNTFAHSILEITFETPEISAACTGITTPGSVKEIAPGLDEDWEIDSPKGKFLMAAFLYAVLFISRERTDPQPSSPDKPAQ